jgi:Spy/CpxP family protein refolding chaperone
MTGTTTPTDEALAAGERALSEAADLFAKAADLDRDFGDLDDAQAASAEGEGDDDEEEGGEDESADALGAAPQGDDEDEDEEEEGAGGPPMMKAADPGSELTIDALPILEALDRNINALTERLTTLTEQNASLLRIAKAQQVALGHFSKAQGHIANLPQRPKSQRAVVPTSVPATAPDINALFAKANEVVSDPVQFGLVEHHYNRRNPEGMLSALTPEQRARVLAPSA